MTSDRDREEDAGVWPDRGLSNAGGPPELSDLEAEWTRVPADPDPERHLGYEWIPFEVFGPDEKAGQYRILPTDEELLKRDAFVVLEPDRIEDLDDWR